MRRILAATLFLAALLACSNFLASRRVDHWTHQLIEAEAPGRSDHLVVIVHGWMSFEGGLTDAPPVVAEAFGDPARPPDVAAFFWDDSFFSNADPSTMGAKLNADLDRLVRERGYETITLVGHSVGALLVRRALLYGRGVGADHPGDLIPRTSWTDKVDRIVLLAGMNKGWARPKSLIADFLLGLTGLTGNAKLAFDVERGSSFIGDMRIEWLRENRMSGK